MIVLTTPTMTPLLLAVVLYESDFLFFVFSPQL
jgi:hypothetical protein